ncbi:tyrosine-type recombinase/integrase [Rhodohalobacter halophilus]|uniref:tyrosine-type recombinase/integrase n=1 Tax=Rhodohalobacter halophilus TaxID=1812810 RepID=UPI00083FCB77|nr:site-specific integrase [Rhodohalobacter halophilus]
MNYKIYPYKRGKLYRIFVVFKDDEGRKKTLSTGITYPLRTTQKKRDQAMKTAEKAGFLRILEYKKIQEEENKIPGDDLLSKYLKENYNPHIRANCAPKTGVSYRNAMKHFIRICGDKVMKKYSRKDIQDYKIHRYDVDGIQKITINIEMRSIKSAFYWAYKNEMIDRMPYKGQDYLFEAKANRRAFEEFEIKKLFRVTEGKMIGLIVRLAYYTGMRIGEMSDITWRMVNLEDKYIQLSAEITKANCSRAVPLNDKAFNVIKIFENQLRAKQRKNPEWYEGKEISECYVLQKHRGYGKYERRGIQDMFRKSMNEAELPKELKFHCLRHSFATHVLQKGADIYGVSKIMGHSTPVVTAEFYDHSTALNYRGVTDLLG